MFDILKSEILQALCVALVDIINESIEVEIHMDASQCALGGVFLAFFERNWTPVAYHSHKFN